MRSFASSEVCCHFRKYFRMFFLNFQKRLGLSTNVRCLGVCDNIKMWFYCGYRFSRFEPRPKKAMTAWLEKQILQNSYI